jgi:tetratricopeptide (TPR) repeat protein
MSLYPYSFREYEKIGRRSYFVMELEILVQQRNQAQTLRREGHYSDALPFFEQQWQATRDKWDGWNYAYCLRKLERVGEALNVCHAFLQNSPEFPQGRSLYGWCIYDQQIRGKRDTELQCEEANFIRAVDAIATFTRQEPYSPYEIAICRLLRYLNGKRPFPAREILHWTERLDPGRLSDETATVTGVDGTLRELSSHREDWYANRCRALFELHFYEDCIYLCREALAKFTLFHHNNGILLRWRLARSLFLTGYSNEALWILRQTALEPGELINHFRIYFTLGQVLASRNEIVLARKHICLAVRALLDTERPLQGEIAEMMQSMEINLQSLPTAEDLRVSLQDYWQAMPPVNWNPPFKAGQQTMEERESFV